MFDYDCGILGFWSLAAWIGYDMIPLNNDFILLVPCIHRVSRLTLVHAVFSYSLKSSFTRY
jgi:hypothetical protein